MRILQKKIGIRSKNRNDFIKITGEVEKLIAEAKIKNGILSINIPHTTAAIILQEGDSALQKDLIKTLDRLVSLDEKYEHVEEGKENAIAHIKSNLLGHSVSLSIKEGRLQLGTWQDIFFVELFEGREREVIITVMGE